MFLKWNSSSKPALFWDISDVPEQPTGAIFEGSSSWILDNWKMGPTGCPETSVRNYHYSLCNSTEERSSHLLRGKSLKSSLLPLRTASLCKTHIPHLVAHIWIFIFCHVLTCSYFCLSSQLYVCTIYMSSPRRRELPVRMPTSLATCSGIYMKHLSSGHRNQKERKDYFFKNETLVRNSVAPWRWS